MDGVSWAQCDLRDPLAVRALLEAKRPKTLMHLAWRAAYGGLWGSPENFDWIPLSFSLARAFADAGGERMVFCGSCAEYSWDGGLCTEDSTPLVPSTVYGWSKASLHHALQGLAMQTGVSLAWARPFFIYGEGEHSSRLGAAVIEGLLRGEPVETSHGLQIRDYMHVADVADGLAALAGDPALGDFNIASGEAIRVLDLVTEIAKQLDREDLLRVGARPAPAFEPPVILGDVTKAKETLGWTRSIALSEGVARAIAWSKDASPAAI